MTYMKSIIFAATTFAIALSAANSASALSIELPPGVELKQDCKDKTFTKTVIDYVQHGHHVIAVPKAVNVTKTVCTNYYTQASKKPTIHGVEPLTFPENDPGLEPTSGGINGYNVRAVYVAGGGFVQTGQKQWVEHDKLEQIQFTFVETGRDRSSVYLYDRSRDVSIALNLEEQLVRYQGKPLYTIITYDN